MCNIAAYVGTRRAAPILLDMIKKEEGFDGGYYTGIATVSDGKIYYAKLTGDTDRLVALTDAYDLPGNIGIVHSRSKSGGGDEWAHPFLDKTESLAYVANGSAGFFKDDPARGRLAKELFAGGYTMRSACKGQVGKYPTLPGGECVHVSDVMCQLIKKNVDEGAAVDLSMEKAFTEMPSEIVGLCLSLSDPDGIFFARVNCPMFLGLAPDGACLSSTPSAFPKGLLSVVSLPILSRGRVGREGYTAVPFGKAPLRVANVTERVFENARAYAEKMLSGEAYSFPEIRKALRPFFDPADTGDYAALAYAVLDSFMKEDRLVIETRRTEGACDGLDAPKCYFSLKG